MTERSTFMPAHVDFYGSDYMYREVYVSDFEQHSKLVVMSSEFNLALSKAHSVSHTLTHIRAETGGDISHLREHSLAR